MIHLTAVFHVEEGIEHALGLAIAIIKKTMIITDMMIITTISARDRQPGLKPATHKHVQVIHISIFRNSTHKIKSKKLIIFLNLYLSQFCPQSSLNFSTARSGCPPLWTRILSFPCFHSSYEQPSIVINVQLPNIKLVHRFFKLASGNCTLAFSICVQLACFGLYLTKMSLSHCPICVCLS